MKVDIFTFCDSAQEYQNKLIIVGTFNSIFAPEFPAVHREMAIAIRVIWDYDDVGEYRVSLVIKKEDEDVFLMEPAELGNLKIQNVPVGGHLISNIIVKSNNINLPSDGKFIATLRFNDQEYSSDLILAKMAKPNNSL